MRVSGAGDAPLVGLRLRLRVCSSASRARAESAALRPELQTPVESRSMVRTVRPAAALPTYVGSVTGTGSHPPGTASTSATTAGISPVSAKASSSAITWSARVVRRLRTGAVRETRDGALLADHQPAGDEPGDEERRRDRLPCPADDAGGSETDDDQVGEQDRCRAPDAGAGRPGPRRTSGRRVQGRHAELGPAMRRRPASAPRPRPRPRARRASDRTRRTDAADDEGCLAPRPAHVERAPGPGRRSSRPTG